MNCKKDIDTAFDISLPCKGSYNKKGELWFDPPVYKQRYGQIFSILLTEKWRSRVKKIVDIGSGEFGLFTFLKRLVSVEEIVFVDVDQAVLEEHLFKLRPLNFDYVKSRDSPLTVKAFVGSAADPDCRLQNADAVIALEMLVSKYDEYKYIIDDKMQNPVMCTLPS